MGRRILVLLLSALAISVPQVVFALGLGEITLKTALNQPLEAEIELLEVKDLTESEILVGLASAEDFERVGVDRPYFLTGMKFKVLLNRAGGPVIQVTSRKPVREPFLNFVLQAQWPSGRLLREYTLLMDLPVFTGQQSAPVSAAQAQSPQAAPAQQYTAPAAPAQQAKQDSSYNPRSSFEQAPARPAASQASAPSQSYQSTPYPDDAYGPVQANDTLWEIARQVRPDRAVSIQQTMLAIQRLNPEAFINNNINLLRKGQILRVPSRDDITQYSKRQAISEVAVQNSAWSGDAGYSDGGAQIEGSRSISGSDDEPASVEGRVKLSSPEDVRGSAEGRAAGAGSSSVEALENELAITLEQLDMSSRENNDLRSKIQSLEEQIATMERMIEISNEDMRALELAAEKNSAEQEQQLAAAEFDPGEELVPGTDEVVEEDSTDTEIELGSGEQEQDLALAETTDSSEAEFGSEDESAVEATSEPTPQPTAKPAPTKVVQSQPKKTIVDTLMDNIIYIAVGLVLIIGVVIAALKFRKSDDAEEDDFLSQPAFEEMGEPLEEPVEEETFDELDLGEESVEQEPEEEFTEVDDSVAGEAQTEDVVAEADIYIAYGKYDQAEEMLLNALSREPLNTDMRLKLLEVYSTQQEIEKFDPHYAKLVTSGSASVKERAAQMREAFPGAPDFDISLYDTEAHLDSGVGSSLNELDSQLGAEAESDFDELSHDLESTDALNEESVDESLDFDLQLDEQALESDEGSLESGADLDFDLELEESDAVGGDLDLDLDIEASETPADSESIEFDLETDDSELSTEDFDLDFDLDAEDSGEPSDSSAELSLDQSADDFDLDFDSSDSTEEQLGLGAEAESVQPLDDELSAELDDILSPQSEAGADDLSLGDDLSVGLESEPESGLGAEAEPVEKTESVEDFLAGMQQTDEQGSDSESAGDFDLDDDLDLSALDEELDALTSDLGVQEADIENLEVGGELAGEDQLSQLTVMDEPVTDFGDLDLEAGLEATEAEPLANDLDVQEHATLEDVQPETTSTEAGEEQLFDQAIADVPESDLEFNIPEVDPDADDDDLGFLSDSDETATKLDLARAYIDMGDAEGAKDILQEIIKEGNDQQKQEAENLMSRV